MTAEGTAKEMRLFLEALVDTVKRFKKKSPETRYKLSFGYVVRSAEEVTANEALVSIDKLTQAVSQLADDQRVAVEVNIPMVNRLQDDFQTAVQKFISERQESEKKLKAVPNDGTK